ncbi:zinc finger protein 391-like [Entelurus aequoreus]|uniref:zinc finger protein 391-like n=1 Tax=Entelurus aequoreus TaxID=161455 RepID=UPI002B1D1094|nr:zinc finger protein 391-like [Entelurus aequoreus]
MDDYCYAKMATSAKREHERESAPPTSSKSPTEIKTKTADKKERLEISNNAILEAIINPEKTVAEIIADLVEQVKQRNAMIVSLKKAVEFTSEEMKECKSQMKKVEEQNKRLCKENRDLKEEMLGKSKRCAVCEEKTGPHVYINVQRIGDVQQLIGHPEELSSQSLGGSSTLKQEASQPPHIKEEEDELWISQEGECHLGLEEADLTKFPLTVVTVKTEDDEEKPQADNILAPLSHSEAEDEVEETLSSDTDCEGNMRTDSKHHKEKTVKSWSCSFCGKIFTKKSNLTYHVRTHLGEKPFSCSICGKSYAQRSILSDHMRAHTGEKPFICSVCDKSFSQKRYLTEHMRAHTEENPIKCSVCGKSFTKNSNLTQHMRTHTGEKPFNCSDCGKSFFSRAGWTRHTMKHTGEKQFSCSVCNKRFLYNADMVRHIRTHTGEKPFKCSICGKSYTQSGTLSHHMRTHSGEKTMSC